MSKSEGARAPKRCDLYLVRQPFGARVRCFAKAEVAVTTAARFWSHPATSRDRAVVVQDLWPLRCSNLSGAADEGLPCVPLLGAPGLDRCPGI